MPNWCNNNIVVRGSNQAEIQRLVEAFKAGSFCNAVIPVPEDLKREGSSTFGGLNADDNDRIRAENREKHGYESWYDFCISRWGTKWDVGDEHSIDVDQDGLGFSARFDSAWSPPVNVALELVDQGLEVTLHYYEPGMGFVGKFEDGNDDYYELSGENSLTVRDTIGDDLDEMFGISESMAEHEAENEEELTSWIKEGKEKLGLVAG